MRGLVYKWCGQLICKGVAPSNMLFLSSSYSPSLIAGIRFVSQLHPPPLKTRLLPDGALAGKTALVTGGGTGLGRGIAEMMAALGASVGIASR